MFVPHIKDDSPKMTDDSHVESAPPTQTAPSPLRSESVICHLSSVITEAEERGPAC